MIDPDATSSVFGKFVDWLWAVVLGAVGLLYSGNEKKLDKLSSRIDAKADETDLTRIALSVDRLNNELANDRRDAATARERLLERMQAYHDSLSVKIDALKK